MAQFAAFSNEIAPQSYWNTFHTEGNRDEFAARGRFVDRADMTPEWWLNQTVRDLGQYNLPLRPIGQGAAPVEEWRRFIGHAASLNMPSIGAMAPRHRDARRVRRVSGVTAIARACARNRVCIAFSATPGASIAYGAYIFVSLRRATADDFGGGAAFCAHRLKAARSDESSRMKMAL